MRVLLKEGAEKATATNILILPDFAESVLETLSGEGVLQGGIVAEADNWTAADAISTAVEERATRSVTCKRLIEEVELMALLLSPYEVGSKIKQHVTSRGCILDASEAKRVSGSTLTRGERRQAEEADAHGDYGSLASRLGRLGDARDATVHSLEQLRRRPDARSQDVRAREVQLADYDREMAELRKELRANPSRSSS